MKTQKVKNILFKMKIKGNGIVNYDSSEQKKMIGRTNLSHMKTSYDNTSFAKKRFYGTPEDTTYKIIISSDCLRHDIFRADAPFHSPNVMNQESLLTAFIASPTSLLRGYMFAGKDVTYKRKSPFIITAAEQTNDAISYIETFASSAPKNSDKDKETADNTFYKKEVIGEIEYEATGFIDLMNLQFVSCDQVFDRYSFDPDLFNVYKKFMQSRMPSFDAELGYHQIKSSIIEIPEYGFKLSNENVNDLVRSLFKRMINMSIKRKDAYAQTSELQYKLVYDVIEDTIDSEDGWISIKSESDINSISIDVEDFYVPADAEKAIQQREALNNEYERLKEKAREEKKAKKEKTKKPTNNE
jgi:hypothetical protein